MLIAELASKNRILLSKVGQILCTHIHIPAFESACNLCIKHRIYRGSSVLVKQVSIPILKCLHEIIDSARAVEGSCKIENPSVQVGSVLEIENSLETACHRLLNKTLTSQFNLCICIAESCCNIESFKRINREIQLDIIGKRSLTIKCIEAYLILS